DRRDTSERPGDESFRGRVSLGEGEIEFVYAADLFAVELDDLFTGNSLEVITPGRRPQFAAADDEEIRRIAACDEAVWIEHQGLVASHVDRLDQGLDEIEAAVRIQPEVEHVGSAATD